MKAIFSEIKTSALTTLALAVVLCGFYPITVWAIAQLLFPHQANGSLIVDPDGTIRGSRLLAQSFTSDKYFLPRPSSAGLGYDAANSSGSNLGPTSQKLSDLIQRDVATYREKNGLSPDHAVPADAVTRSASGLDPHISPANAALQAPRVARTRQVAVERIHELIARHTDGRDGRLWGEAGVNVLTLNRALDELMPEPK